MKRSDRITFEDIKRNDYLVLYEDLCKSVSQYRVLKANLFKCKNIDDFCELHEFRQLGVIPSAKVQRQQYNKIKRYLVNFAVFCRKGFCLNFEDIDTTFYNVCVAIDDCTDAFPYLDDKVRSLFVELFGFEIDDYFRSEFDFITSFGHEVLETEEDR